MSRNGSGTYSLPVGNPVVTGTTISSTWANNTLTDIANALTGSLAADGQTTASGNLNMGTNRIISLADPTSAQDGATKYYVDQLIAALGTMAYQDADLVAITGGAISNVDLDLHTKTNEIYLPVGNTSLRTASPIQGLLRFNTDAGGFYEGYINGNWQKFTTVNEGSYVITYVAVGGGGSGSGGGGGAGQYLSSNLTAIPATTFTFYIGGGGSSGSNGSDSYCSGVFNAVGGGAGAGGASSGGASGNGYAGGISNGGGSGSGGGGGATAPGGNGGDSPPNGGGGGAGAQTLITGTSLYLGGGGGGYTGNGGTAGAGGSGGGGGGGYYTAAGPSYGSGSNGSTNTGGGGGGSPGPASPSTTNGGSGKIIISMPTGNYTGTKTGSPTVIVSGANTILVYNASGTYTA